MTALPPLSVLYQEHHRYALAIARRILKDDDQAADVVQNVFARLLSRPARFDGQATYRTWLHRILINASINALRGAKRRVRLESPVWEAEDPLEAAELNERRAQFAEALELLSPQHRLVITLRDLRGYSYPQIAHLMGLPEGTVKSALNRARARVTALCRTRCE